MRDLGQIGYALRPPLQIFSFHYQLRASSPIDLLSAHLIHQSETYLSLVYPYDYSSLFIIYYPPKIKVSWRAYVIYTLHHVKDYSQRKYIASLRIYRLWAKYLRSNKANGPTVLEQICLWVKVLCYSQINYNCLCSFPIVIDHYIL